MAVDKLSRTASTLGWRLLGVQCYQYGMFCFWLNFNLLFYESFSRLKCGVFAVSAVVY